MSGSSEVNAKLAMWMLVTHKELEAAMDTHIIESKNFATGNHPWNDLTGATTGYIDTKTDAQPAQIVSTIGHTGENPQIGLFLETAWFFGGKYKILERARSNNLIGLWTRLRGIMSGSGFIRGGI